MVVNTIWQSNFVSTFSCDSCEETEQKFIVSQYMYVVQSTGEFWFQIVKQYFHYLISYWYHEYPTNSSENHKKYLKIALLSIATKFGPQEVDSVLLIRQ